MCGIVGCVLCDKQEAVNQVLYDGLTMVQVSGRRKDIIIGNGLGLGLGF